MAPSTDHTIDKFIMDIDFTDKIDSFLDEETKEEDSLLLMKTFTRILENGSTDIEPQIDKRIALLPISSEGPTAPTTVIDDVHWDFRLQSQLIFESEEQHPLMRGLIKIQLNEFRDYYVKTKFNGRANLFELLYQEIDKNRSCQLSCLPFLADLFQVRIWDVKLGGRRALLEYLPASPKRLETLCEDDYIPRKTFFVNSDSREVLRAVNVTLHQIATVSNVSMLQLPKLTELLKKQPFSSHDVIAFCRGIFVKDDSEVVSANEDKRLDKRLKELNFERDKMRGDGNCMLRALSKQVLKDQKRHMLMRRVITARFLYRPNQYSNLPRFRAMKMGPREPHRDYDKRESWRSFRKRMSKVFEWGNGLVLQAAADAFCIKISVIYSDEELVMAEYFPQGKEVYYDSIFLCANSTHMDCLKRA